MGSCPRQIAYIDPWQFYGRSMAVLYETNDTAWVHMLPREKYGIDRNRFTRFRDFDDVERPKFGEMWARPDIMAATAPAACVQIGYPGLEGLCRPVQNSKESLMNS